MVTAEEVYASVCAVDRPGGGDGRGGIRQCVCVLLTGLVVVTAEEVYASVCAVDRPGGGDGRGGIRQCVCC